MRAMLHSAERAIDYDDDVVARLPMASFSVLPTAAGSPSDSSSYGAPRSPNYVAILLILLFHATLIYAITQARHHYVRAKEARLAVLNLTPPSPPPPAAETPPPPPSAPQVVAPPPIVRTPEPNLPRMATTPEPVAISPLPIMPVATPALSVPASPPAPPSTTVQGGDLGTQMVSGKPPRYPIECRRKREQGTVVLSLTVGTDGRVERIAIAHSSGSSRLDDAARDAVRHWRWKPLLRDGHPMRVKGVVEIPFMLTASA